MDRNNTIDETYYKWNYIGISVPNMYIHKSICYIHTYIHININMYI